MRAAIYSRYSTDRQSESSIEDQARVCAEWSARNDIAIVARFEDQGISGAAIGNRPGLQALLNVSADVIVVMDLTRLSRSQADLPKIIDRLVHRGLRIVGVQDGYDSARKGHKLQAGLTGIIGEASARWSPRKPTRRCSRAPCKEQQRAAEHTDIVTARPKS